MSNGMCVLHGSRVELPKVYTEPQAAVLFLHHDDWRGPGTVGRTDDTAGQHLLDLGHLFSNEQWGFWRQYGWRSGGPSVSMVC